MKDINILGVVVLVILSLSFVLAIHRPVSFETSPILAICSAECLEKPINLQPQLKAYFTKGNINVFYEPYTRNLGCYDLNKVENKQCCIQYRIR